MFLIGIFLAPATLLWSAADDKNAFRVTEYYLGVGVFTGVTYELTLDQDLEYNHFIFVKGSDGDGSSGNNRGPDENYARVAGLPSGMNGDLPASSGADKIRLKRINNVDAWVGVVTVVECLGDCTASGFRMLDVIESTSTTTSTSGTMTSSVTWSDKNQIVPFGSAFGAGANTGATGTTQHNSAWMRLIPSGEQSILWTRDGGGAGLQTAVHTTYVIEFGSEWTVQVATVTGTSGGDGVDIVGEYDTAAITQVNRDETWVWGTGTSSDNGIGDGAEAVVVTLGDGVNQNTTETTVAIGMEYTDSRTFHVYTLSHPDLGVDYRFKADGDTGLVVVNQTVDTAFLGRRMGWVSNTLDATGNAYPRPLMSARYTADDSVRIERRRSGRNFAAWVQGIDFSSITYVIPERYWVSLTEGDWSDTSNWSETSGGPGGATAPDATKIAIFDGAGGAIGDVRVDTTVVVSTISIKGSYSGTIRTRGYGVTVSSFSQSSGKVKLGTTTFTVDRDFIRTGGNFSADTSTIVFSSNTLTQTLTPGNTAFHHVHINKPAGVVNITENLDVDGNLTLQQGELDTGSDYDLNVAGSLTQTSGVLTLNGSTLTMDGTGDHVLSLSITMNNVIINKTSGGRVSLGQALDIDGNFDIQNGTFSTSGSHYNVTLRGDLDNAGTFDTNNSTVTFDGPIGSTTTITGSSTFYILISTIADRRLEFAANTTTYVTHKIQLEDLNIHSTSDGTVSYLAFSGSSQTFTNVRVQDSWARGGKMLQAGTDGFDAGNNFNWAFGDATRYWISADAGNWDERSRWSMAKGGLGGDSVPSSTHSAVFDGTLELHGNAKVNTAASIGSLSITNYGGRLNTNGYSFTVGGALTQSSGTIRFGTSSVVVQGDFLRTNGGLAADTSTVTFSGTASQNLTSLTTAFHHIVIDKSAGSLTLQDALDVNGRFTLTNGTFDSNGYAISVVDDWSYTGGTYTHSNSTVTFDGTTNATLAGSTTFYGLVSTQSGLTLQLSSGTTTYVLNRLNFENIAIRSTVDGESSFIDLSGPSQTIANVNVRDSNANLGNEIFANDGASVDSGNNPNWNFGPPDAVDNLSALVGTDDQTINLSWSAPGDDASVGDLNNATFTIQYTTIAVFNDWDPTVSLTTAPIIEISTTGVSPDDIQTYAATALHSNATHYFRIWTQDDELNYSSISNGATVATLAKQIQNASDPFKAVYVTSVTITWFPRPTAPSSMTAEGYLVEASTDSLFKGLILSSKTTNVNLSTLTVQGLNSETTYYFRIASLNWVEEPHLISVPGSTQTLASIDTIPPDPVGDLAASVVSNNSVQLTWLAPFDPTDNPLSGNYAIQHATYTSVTWSTSSAQVNFSTSSVSPDANQNRLVGSLDANTTYYFQIWTSDLKPNWSGDSNQPNEATLANPLQNIDFNFIQTSSVALQWTAFPATPQKDSAIGYRLEASTASNFTGTILSSETANLAQSTLTLTSLDPNTTYYFRAASINIENIPNYSSTLSTSTLANKVALLSNDYIGVFESSVTAHWAALPSAPPEATSEGYKLVASSTNFDGTGVIHSSITTNVLRSTLTITGLISNLTYYFRVGSLNWVGVPHYSTLAATSTLTDIPTSVTVTQVLASTASLSWGLPAAGAEGFRIDASSTNFDGTGTILSSRTANGTRTNLSVTSLLANTTYFFRVGSLNWNESPHYAQAVTSATLANAPQHLATDFIEVNLSSITAHWVALPATPEDQTSEGYRLEGSSTNFNGTGILYSSTTPNVLHSTLTLTSLDPNLTYYFRVGSLNWNNQRNYTTLTTTSTLAQSPVSVASTYTAVALDSLTAQWGANGNPDGTRYRLQTSTAANFTGTLLSSVTVNLSASIGSLSPNTTYYGRVQAVNNNSIGSTFTPLGSTITLSAPPSTVSPIFDPVNLTSMTVLYGAGSPANPDGTIYSIEISTFVNFFTIFATSNTPNLSAGFTGLSINTTYYARGRTQNGAGVNSAYTDLTSTATLAVEPHHLASTFTSVTSKAITFQWSSGTAAGGYNPTGTIYNTQISEQATFTTIITNAEVTTTNHTFGGLASDTIYYVRVRAVNHQHKGSAFVNYGSTRTETSSVPTFIPGSFQVTDKTGTYIDGTMYTDTTTVNVRIQIQSTQSPGLAVTDVPATTVIWWADEGSGTSIQDASGHGITTNAQGTPTPAWADGLIENAADFSNGDNAYISPEMGPWREVDHTFSIEFWFKGTSNVGHMFEDSTSNTLGTGGTRDNQFTWLDGGNFTWRLSGGGGSSNRITASDTFLDDEWHYVVGVVGTSQRFLYVDGNLEASANLGNVRNDNNYYHWVGAGSDANNGQGNGSRYSANIIDMVRVSTVAYTEEEIDVFYDLAGTKGHKFGAPAVDISTQNAANFTWVRQSTDNVTITGSNGSVNVETFTATSIDLIQTKAGQLSTNQVKFFGADLDNGLVVGEYNILVDTTPPTNVGISSITVNSTNTLTATVLTAVDPLSGLNSTPYLIEMATATDFSTITDSSGFIASQSHSFTNLDPNTTYYFRVTARDVVDNQSTPSTGLGGATLAQPVENISIISLSSFSATLGWAAFPVTPSSHSAKGYQLEASTTNFDGTGITQASSTLNVLLSTLTVPNLDPNTTYYFRVGSLNWVETANYTAGGSSSTLAAQVGSPTLNTIYVSSATVSWSTSTNHAKAYRLDASTMSDFTGLLVSSFTLAQQATTLTLTTLSPNTTYFLRVAALNWNNVDQFADAGSSVTHTNTVINPNFSQIFISSATLAWTEPAGGVNEYHLEASTMANFTGTILTSSTFNTLRTTLTVTSLDPNTTYYFRVGAENWNNIIRYVNVSGTSTLTNFPGSTGFTNVYITSATVNWTVPTGDAEGYRVEASTDASYDGTVLTSATTNGLTTNLTVTSLDPNTTYYVRVAALNWNDVRQYADIGSTSTFANGPQNVKFSSVDISSVAVTWAIPVGGAAGYRLDASTNSNFADPITSSITYNGSRSTLTVTSLSPNTTYFFRVGALNWNDEETLSVLGSTSTRTNPPTALAVTDVQFSTATLSWTLPAGGASGYRLEASTASNFTGTLLSSSTPNGNRTSLIVSSLDSNTTYYFQVGAINWNDDVNFSSPASTSTLAGPPTAVTFSNVHITSASLSWTLPVGGAAGYQLDASTASNYTGTVHSSITSNGSRTSLFVTSLDPNTTYYFRVASINWNEKRIYANDLTTSTLSNQPQTVNFGTISTTTIQLTWSAPVGGSSGFRVEASTASNFTGTLFSSSTANAGRTDLTLSNLSPNTTYFTRVGAVNWNNVVTYAADLSSSTLSKQVKLLSPSVLTVYESSITVRWAALASAPQSDSSEGYQLDASSTDFNGTGVIYSSRTTNVTHSTLTITSLDPNLTYYFRVASLNWNETRNYTTLEASSTLAGVVGSPSFTAVHISSVALSWSVPTGGAEGYRAEASTDSDFNGTVLSSITLNGLATAITIESLISETTYFFRIASLNWNQVRHYVSAGSTKTRTSIDLVPPSAVLDLSAATASTSTIRVSWSAPNDPTDNPLSGSYFIQHATFTSVTWSTTNAQVSIATSGVSPSDAQSHLINNLDPNTTYYFRIWTQDAKPNTSPLSNGATAVTLAKLPTSVAFVDVFESSTSLSWTAFPPTPSSETANGFILEASTASDFTGTIQSSITTNGTASTLTVLNLDRNTTYYYRLGSRNWASQPNYASSLSTSTLASEPSQLATDFISATTTTITARWVALPTAPQASSAEGYRLEGSTTDFDGTGVVHSSETTDVSVSTLTLGGLLTNVTYYFRVASLNWNDVANFTSLSATSTLSTSPVAGVPIYTPVYITSVTLNYQANGNADTTLYHIDLSTESDFDPVLNGTETTSLTYTFTSLSPNATVYTRVQSINHNNVRSAFVNFGSTMTLASLAQADVPLYDPVEITSFTVHFTSGIPGNPDGTLYVVETSSTATYDTVSSSQTPNLTAGFTGLIPNTTYYTRIEALNGLGRSSGYSILGSSVTHAALPGPVTSTFTNVESRSFTLNWSSGQAQIGFNPTDTTYEVQISTESNFSSLVSDTDVIGITNAFPGLDPGTTYYARVRARNHQNILSGYREYGSVTTLQTSEPEFNLGTFQVTNSSGTYISPSLYTDTINPNVRIDVKSPFAPGLAVTDTPSHLGLWHFEEGTGTTAQDSSLHGNDLTLTGSPDWTNGVSGNGVEYDGTNYSVGATNITPWRKTATENAWTVELWFKTSSNSGYLFQSANTASPPASAFDLDIGWHNTSGNLAFALRTTGGVQKIAESSQNYADNNWHYVAARLNSSNMSLFVDGQLVASNSEINATSAKVYSSSIYAWVGAANTLDSNIGNGSRFTTAVIDEVLISTVAFSDGDIAENYQLTGVKGIAPGGPAIDVSTEAGNHFTWVRISSDDVSLTGTNGSNNFETMTGSSLNLRQSTSALADTNRVTFLATSIDGLLTTAQFTIYVDTTPPQNVGVNQITSVSTESISLSLLTATDGLSGLTATPYLVELSTASDFSVINSSSGLISSTSHTFNSLDPNTTYYFRVNARDVAGNISPYSTTVSTPTLANPLTDADFFQVNETSVTVNWTPHPTTPSSSSASGYILQASTASDFTGTLYSSSTADGTNGNLTVTGLSLDTTYYFQVGALNWADVPHYATVGSTTTVDRTPPAAITNLSALPGTSGGTIDLTWSAPGDDGLSGNLNDSEFIIQYTTDTAFSSWDPQAAHPAYVSRINISTDAVTPGSTMYRTLSGLISGGTYYVRTWTRDNNNNYSTISNAATTYAKPIVLGISLSTNVINIPGLTDMGTVIVLSTPIIVTNTGNVTETYEFRATTTTPGSPWAIGTTQDTDQYILWGVVNSTQPASGDFKDEDKLSHSNTRCTSTVITMGNSTCVSVPVGETRTIWFKLAMPTLTSTGAAQSIQITGEATEPD